MGPVTGMEECEEGIFLFARSTVKTAEAPELIQEEPVVSSEDTWEARKKIRKGPFGDGKLTKEVLEKVVISGEQILAQATLFRPTVLISSICPLF